MNLFCRSDGEEEGQKRVLDGRLVASSGLQWWPAGGFRVAMVALLGSVYSAREEEEERKKGEGEEG
jgi:hypothetical protein